MAAEDGNADRRRRNGNGVIVKHLVRFVDHLHFFLGIIVFYKLVDLRNQIKGNGIVFRQALAGQDLRFHVPTGKEGFRFFTQFVEAFFSGTGNGLIGADDDPFDRRQIVDGL